ncbi:glutamine amidotransferase [Marinicella meishanensis]|uniref:glutamine amidotransferase n=1 Tax=Marinicella meishanensis TaxID=2873263 RepID=UPI001CBE46F2|nr:glutamine amidotransferase [Marinicella sp. NBU2979]
MYLIIQTGDPVPSAQRAFGPFSRMFCDAMQLDQAQVINVHRHEPLPAMAEAAEQLTGVIITGSAAMVTDQDDWLRKTQAWLQASLAHHIPTLGVCFGHQLLVDLLGGQVAYNPHGRNLGLSRFSMSAAAADDPLLGPIAPLGAIDTLASHLQVATRLPQSATLLGHCALDEHHAFHAEQVIWGLQFHPEWNPTITQHYIETRSPELRQEDHSPKAMIEALRPCPEATALLRRFRQLAEQRRAA